MIASPQVKPTPGRVGLGETLESLLVYDEPNPIYLAPILEPRILTSGEEVKDPVSDPLISKAFASESSLSYLAIRPKKGTAAIEQLRLKSVKDELKEMCGAEWQGGALIGKNWQNPGRTFYVIHKDRRSDLEHIFERRNISQEEVELVPTYADPNYLKKISKVSSKIEELRAKIQFLQLKELKETHETELLYGADGIGPDECEERLRAIRSRYDEELDPLKIECCKLENVEIEILGEGISPTVESFAIKNGETHLAARKASQILSDPICGVFQRMGQTVRIVKYRHEPEAKTEPLGRPEGSFFIKEADEMFLVKLLSEKFSWVKLDKRTKKEERIDCPDRVARYVLSDHGASLPVLTGFICAPTLRVDGSILDLPGYDTTSGVFFDPCGVKFPPIPQYPMKDQAVEALAKLKDLLKDFRFDGEVSHAVAIAEIMTGVIRRSLEYAPAFGNNAPEAGSGKSLLGDVAAIIATGNRCTCISPSRNEEEHRKRFASALLGGDLVICIDNIQEPFESESMCTILTSQRWQERILGTNTRADMPTNSLFIFTGNNLTFRGDMCARVVVCNIDPQTECPGERSFDRDLRKYAANHRGELVVAILTIVRAYLVAGCPNQNLPPFRLFTDWTRWIRSPLVWLGMSDPYESTRSITDNDPIRTELGILFAAWYEAMRPLPMESITIKQLIEIVQDPKRREDETIQNLYSVLLDFSPDGRGGIDPRVFGNKVRQFKGRTVGGYRLDSVGKDRSKALIWQIRKV